MSFLFMDADRCPFCHGPAHGRFGLCRDCLDALEAPGACHSLRESHMGDGQKSDPVSSRSLLMQKIDPDSVHMRTASFAIAEDGSSTVPFYAYSALFYNPFLRHFFGAYKFRQKTVYEPVFQAILAEYAQQHPLLSRSSWVSYIPQSHRREVLRGSHPAKALAEAVASALKLPLLPLLQKGHTRQAQKKSSAWERLTNVQGAFFVPTAALTHPPYGLGIICDDFLTTGNTLLAALQALQKANLYAVGLVLACVDYPSDAESEGEWLRKKLSAR